MNLITIILVASQAASMQFSEGKADLTTIPRNVCEVFLTQQVDYIDAKMKRGFRREQIVEMFKNKYYSSYFRDYVWQYADQVYDLTLQAQSQTDQLPSIWVNETLCSKMEIHHTFQ